VTVSSHHVRRDCILLRTRAGSYEWLSQYSSRADAYAVYVFCKVHMAPAVWIHTSLNSAINLTSYANFRIIPPPSHPAPSKLTTRGATLVLSTHYRELLGGVITENLTLYIIRGRERSSTVLAGGGGGMRKPSNIRERGQIWKINKDVETNLGADVEEWGLEPKPTAPAPGNPIVKHLI
jgi:hypothetical protein